ncbi:MAG: leucyl aminopeptidase [Rickettsiales bacterium]|nr:leucyl aminopeptidase [Rickettsiales bacterium]|tara:strand:- start:1506 stop:3074 length:1569 start_codon:yes stop_codon:yes gene_type:complete
MTELSFKIDVKDYDENWDNDTTIVGVFFDKKKNLVFGDRQVEATGFDKKELKKLAEYHDFKGEAGQLKLVSSPFSAVVADKKRKLYLLGLGDLSKASVSLMEQAGDKAWGSLKAVASKKASFILPLGLETTPGSYSQSDFFEAFLFGLTLKSYSFDTYKTKDKKDDEDKAEKLESLTFVGAEKKTLKAVASDVQSIVSGVFTTRDFCNEPPNELRPHLYAKAIKALFKGTNVKVTLLNEKKLKDLKANLFLSVGQASDSESHAVILEYKGKNTKSQKQPIAFVGKGVTFDTGGNNIKPSNGMGEMKMDMGGSAVVVGLMRALDARKANVHAVGIVGLVENMVAGNASRPSDVVKAMSGKTVEINNTDAEGRLVLADAMWHVQTKYKPSHMVDLATLTGAVIHALGGEYAAVFSNSDEMASSIVYAGEQANEPAWRMPLCEGYSESLKSDTADLSNIAKSGTGAGSATAASFLKEFVQEGVNWTHIDIAGTTMMKGKWAHVDKGATGYGVRILDRYVRNEFEK